jgi:hypothetical protein
MKITSFFGLSLVLILFISCNNISEKFLKVYINDKRLLLSKSDNIREIYEGNDRVFTEVFYGDKRELKEIRNYNGTNLFGDNLFFKNGILLSYYFMTNDINTSYEIKFNDKGKVVYELGTPIVYEELSQDTTKDSVQIDMVLCKAVFKDLHLKCSIDGKNYQESKLQNGNSNQKYINNYIARYAFPIPLKKNNKKDVNICLYRIIKGKTIYGEIKEYNDTLHTYIRNKYLK